MSEKSKNIMKAFLTGFIVVAVILLLMQIIAPILGFDYVIGWKSTFELSKGMVHASWFAPLLIGLIFAVIQFFEDYESTLVKYYRKVVKTDEAHKTIAVLWHGFWGLAVGFVISMFLLALIVGTNKTYIIPYVLEATAGGGTVRATTSIMTVFTILGLIWGVWKAEHLPKHKETVKAIRKPRVAKKKPVRAKKKPVKKKRKR